MLPYKDDNPSSTIPVVNYFFIAVNVVVFFYMLTLGQAMPQFVLDFGTVPTEIASGQNLPTSERLSPWLSLLSSMFLHGGFLHIASNMLFLQIFGDNVEDALGHTKYFLFYVATGIGAMLVQVLADPHATIPTVGASGAIAAVLGAYFVLYPQARIRSVVILFIFITTIRLPASLVLGMWFAVQVLNGFLDGAQLAGVAWFAHIGGFVMGLLFTKALLGKQGWERVMLARRRIRIHS